MPRAWRSTHHQHGVGFVQSRQSTVGGGGEGTDLERATDRWKGEKEDEMLPATFGQLCGKKCNERLCQIVTKLIHIPPISTLRISTYIRQWKSIILYVGTSYSGQHFGNTQIRRKGSSDKTTILALHTAYYRRI